MNIALKVISTITLLFLMLFGAIFAANNGMMDKPIRLGVEYYFSLKNIKLKLYDFHIYKGLITSSNVQMKNSKGVVQLQDVEINASLSSNFLLSAELKPTNVKILDHESNEIVQAVFSSSGTADIEHINNIKISIEKIHTLDASLNEGNINFSYARIGEQKLIKGKAIFADSMSLEISPGQESNKIHIYAKSFPISIHQIVAKILPDNELIQFLEQYMSGGCIEYANIDYDLDSPTISEQSLSGSAKIRDLDYKYDPILPVLNFKDVDLTIKGKKIEFTINEAYSTELLISDGLVSMNWEGQEKTILHINAKAVGPTRGLTDFIPLEEHEAMNKTLIDLKQITGSTMVNIEIQVPLKPETENIYNIRADIPNASLEIFAGHARLKNAKLSGVFDGKHVIIEGDGKLNDFNTHLDFVYNAEDIGEFNHRLNLRTHFKTRGKKERKIAFVSLLSGESIVDLEYVNRDSKGYITVNSDISSLGLYFDKLGIRKRKNIEAKVNIDAIFDNPNTGKIAFNIDGNEHLNVLGEVVIENSRADINFRKIKNDKTDINGTLHLSGEDIFADLKGKVLDFSNVDMMQFLTKERDGGGARVRADIDKILLKNNVLLDDARLILECDNIRCSSGYFDSKINGRALEMLLNSDDDYQENWIINCGDAGAFLKGIEAYESIKSGQLFFKISTSRKEVKPGEIIPLLDGDFSIERFELQNTPSVIKLVSLTSIPGFLSIITGNKDIYFSGMNGNFSFQDNILRINDSFAKGPFFDFSMKGDIDISNKNFELSGHVNPAFYGVSSVIGSIPIFGQIFTGNKSQRGIISKEYKIQDKY